MSDIKRGYPNPNYSDEDVGGEYVNEPTVTLPASLFFELSSKATALDIIAVDIKANIDSKKTYSRVNDSIVMAVTGINAYLVSKGGKLDE